MELTIALLTILFYHHNKKTSAEKHMCSTKIKPVAPDDANIINEFKTVMSENVPIRKGISTSKEEEPARCSVYPNKEVSHSQSSDPVIVMAHCIEDLCQEQFAGGLIQGDNARISHVLGNISLFPAEAEEIMQML